MTNTFGSALGALCGFGVGVGIFFNGWKLFRKKQLIDNIPTSTIRGLAMGLVELNGIAQPSQVMFNGPFSDKQCVIYDYKVERLEHHGRSQRWVTVAFGDSFSCPFDLEDPTGKIRVFPKGNDFMANVDFSYTTGFGMLPERLERFVKMAGISRGFLNLSALRFTERNIKLGEKVFVLGTACKSEAKEEGQNAFRDRLQQRLEELKSDTNFMQGVDTNKDGNISEEEWQTAVSKVEEDLVKSQLAAVNQGQDLNDVVIAQGDLEKTFIISNKSQKGLDSTLSWQIAASLFFGVLAAVFSLWAVTCIFKRVPLNF